MAWNDALYNLISSTNLAKDAVRHLLQTLDPVFPMVRNLETLRNIVQDSINLDELEQMIGRVTDFDTLPDDESKIKKMLKKSGIIDKLTTKISIKPVKNLAKPFVSKPSKSLDLTFDESGSLQKLWRGVKFLQLQLSKGSCFGMDDVIAAHQDLESVLRVHIYFCGSRYSTKYAVFEPEPTFDQKFMFELQVSLADKAQELNTIVDMDCPISIAVTKKNPSGETCLIGSAQKDWRCVFTDQPEFEIEIVDAANPQITVGCLDISLSLITAQDTTVPREQLQFRMDLIREKQQQASRLFYSYARQWWSDFLHIRPSHKTRLVKFFTILESGKRELAMNLVQPIRSLYIETPRHAVRLVSLIELNTQAPIGDVVSDFWMSTHSFLSARKGDVSDHALLLCNLLLGFSLDAYVTFGTDNSDSAHTWVTTIDSSDTITFWESLTGKAYQETETHHFKTVGCMFNATMFYANIQSVDKIQATDFNLDAKSSWKALEPEYIASMKRFQPSFPILGPVVRPREDDAKLERLLQKYVEGLRNDADLPCVWDHELGHLLGQYIWHLETQKLETYLNEASFNDYFQSGIKRLLPAGHCFRGFPCEFKHSSAGNVFQQMTAKEDFKNIMMATGDCVRFGINVRVFSYAEDIKVCWVMLGVRLQG